MNIWEEIESEDHRSGHLLKNAFVLFASCCDEFLDRISNLKRSIADEIRDSNGVPLISNRIITILGTVEWAQTVWHGGIR